MINPQLVFVYRNGIEKKSKQQMKLNTQIFYTQWKNGKETSPSSLSSEICLSFQLSVIANWH